MKSLYEITGRIEDINTVLVKRGEFETLAKAARQAIALLGPEAPLCSGCEYEWNQAIKVLKEALEAAPTGDVVVTKNEAGQIVAVTRQDEDHRILSVIAMSGPMLTIGDTTPEMYSADAKERKNAVEALNKLFRGADQKPTAAEQEPVAYLYCGGQFGGELDEWEIDPVQYQCDKLNEHHGAIGKAVKLPLYTAPQPARQALTDDWIRGLCKESWVFDAAKQWIRIAERAHGIGGEV